MSEMVKYKGSALVKRPKSGPVFHHLWHSPYISRLCTDYLFDLSFQSLGETELLSISNHIYFEQSKYVPEIIDPNTSK